MSEGQFNADFRKSTVPRWVPGGAAIGGGGCVLVNRMDSAAGADHTVPEQSKEHHVMRKVLNDRLHESQR